MLKMCVFLSGAAQSPIDINDSFKKNFYFRMEFNTLLYITNGYYFCVFFLRQKGAKTQSIILIIFNKLVPVNMPTPCPGGTGGKTGPSPPPPALHPTPGPLSHPAGRLRQSPRSSGGPADEREGGQQRPGETMGLPKHIDLVIP